MRSFSKQPEPPAGTPCCFHCGKKRGYGVSSLAEMCQRLVCDRCILLLAGQRIAQLYTPGDVLHATTVRRNAA